MARGFNLKWLGRREAWASTERSSDRIARTEPVPSGPVRRLPPRRDSADEAEERTEQWFIDDLDPLRHEEHTIR